MTSWVVDFGYVKDWLTTLDPQTLDCVTAAVELLSEVGPTLGRPLVDTVSGSRHRNMKELRPTSPGMSEFRILFAFDPKRQAILLLGGDKSGTTYNGLASKAKWAKWYEKAIPEADRRYDEHLRKLDEESNSYE